MGRRMSDTSIETAFTHEWEVVGEPGFGRFVPCDEAGVPLDSGRYRDLRAAEARGELSYLGIRSGPAGAATVPFEGNEDPNGPGRGYATNVLDGAAASDVSLAGSMGLFRE